MTRVEKFHRYREEIANMKIEDNSSKSLASKQVQNMRKNSEKINYDEVINAYGIKNEKSLRIGLKIRLDQVLYVALALIVIATLVALLFIL